MVILLLSNLASIISNVVTHGYGVVDSFKGTFSPVTSGLARTTVLYYLIIHFGCVLVPLKVLIVGRIIANVATLVSVGGARRIRNTM